MRRRPGISAPSSPDGRIEQRATRFLAARGSLARELQQARRDAGLSTHELAARIEMSQSKVSKIENARVGVSVGDAAAWARAVGLDETGVAEVSRRAGYALTETLWRRDLAPGDIAVRQRDVAAFEGAATSIHVYETAIVPGLLQTAEYARRVFAALNEQPGDLAVAARIERQSIVYSHKQMTFLMTAGVLSDIPGPTPLALAQLDRLRNLQTLRNVQIGLVRHPGRKALWVGHAFTLYEGLQDGAGLVSVETLTTHLNISDQVDVETYRGTYRALMAIAEFGRPVEAAIERAMRERAAEPETPDGGEVVRGGGTPLEH